MLKLYHGPTSVCSQKVRVALAEIGLNYDGKLLNLQKGDQFDPDYLKLNPEGVVPTLIDGDLVLVESSLIVEYLDKAHNGGRLMPADTGHETRTRLWLLRCIAVHAAINSLSFSTLMRARILSAKTPAEIEASIARMPDPVMQAKRRDLYANGLSSIYVGQALQHLRRTFADMTRDIGDETWVSGSGFGLADIGLVSYIDRLERLGFAGLWTHDYPAVGHWLAAMRNRASYAPAITAFIPEEQARDQREGGSAHWPELERVWNAG